MNEKGAQRKTKKRGLTVEHSGVPLNSSTNMIHAVLPRKKAAKEGEQGERGRGTSPDFAFFI